MDTEQRLKSYISELEQLYAQGNGRDVLARSGEELALAAEELRTATPGQKLEAALYLLNVSRPHIGALYDAGMPVDALATAMMTLLSCLVAQVNPTDIPTGYLAYLQSIYPLAVAAANNPKAMMSDPDSHLATIAATIGTLATITAQEFSKYPLPASLIATAADIEQDMGSTPSTFGGHTIAPTMAIDILADSLARLRSLSEF